MPVRSLTGLDEDPPSLFSHTASVSYSTVRRDHALVRSDGGAILVLARPDRHKRERLAALGFEPDGMSARLETSSDVARDLLAVHRLFGATALYDTGTLFTLDGLAARRASLPVEWPGQFLMHVGCTSRCLVFDERSELVDLARAYSAAEAEYFSRDYHPATE